SMLCAHAAPMGTTRSRWLRAALTALLFEHSQLSLKSGDPAITVEESRNVRPEYPKDEPSREHVQFVQRGLSYLPRYAIEHSENNNDADPVSRVSVRIEPVRFFVARCLFEGVRVQPTLSFQLGDGLKLLGVSLRVSLNPKERDRKCLFDFACHVLWRQREGEG